MARAWIEWGERQGYQPQSAQGQDFLDPEAIPVSPRLRSILDQSRRQVREGVGMGHEEFWSQIERPETP
jgi:hypothetical protein